MCVNRQVIGSALFVDSKQSRITELGPRCGYGCGRASYCQADLCLSSTHRSFKTGGVKGSTEKGAIELLLSHCMLLN